MRLLKDSSGRKSWHITLAIPALIAGTIWFLAGGIDLTMPNGYHILTATKTGSDYILFVAPWLSALGWRDYLKNGTTTFTTTESSPVPGRPPGGYGDVFRY